MQHIKPNKQFIVATPDDVETKSTSGFLLGENAREVPKTAIVQSVGDEVVGFSEGDRIIYKDYTTTDIKLNDVAYIVLESVDVIGTVIETK